MNEFLFGAWSDLAKFSTRPGLMLESLSPAFTSGPSDSGVGNIQRFLLALDLLASELPLPSSVDSHLAAVLTSFARRERERRQLRSRLQRLGLTVTGIPSLSDADRGINYLNCVHTPASVLVPSYRGLFSELDRTAQSAITAALGANVRLLSIPSGESQRREGALRCAIAVAL